MGLVKVLLSENALDPLKVELSTPELVFNVVLLFMLNDLCELLLGVTFLSSLTIELFRSVSDLERNMLVRIASSTNALLREWRLQAASVFLERLLSEDSLHLAAAVELDRKPDVSCG